MTRIYFVKAMPDGKFKEFSSEDNDFRNAKDKAFTHAKKIMNDKDNVFGVNIIAQDV